MKERVAYTITSLLSVLLLTFHLADDIVRGYEKGGAANLLAIPICVAWLYGTLVLSERRSGYVITLIGSLLAMGVPILHMRGRGLGIHAASSGAFFFFWTILAIGVTALFTFVLSARALRGK